MYGALIGAAIAAIGAIINSSQASKQRKENRALAEYQNDANQKLLEQQLAYNTPKAQMARYMDGGLNPNLIYGQGNPGNQSAPLQYPDTKPADYQKQNLDALVPLFNQTRLVDAQVDAQEASTRQKYALTALNELQAQVLQRNPLLNDEGFTATINGIKAAADLKQSQATGQKIANFQAPHLLERQYEKVAKEVELLDQKFKLNTLDGQIKAEVLKSKEFQNAILEVQKNFMTDSQVTPQHMLQFVQLLLMKIL